MPTPIPGQIFPPNTPAPSPSYPDHYSPINTQPSRPPRHYWPKNFSPTETAVLPAIMIRVEREIMIPSLRMEDPHRTEYPEPLPAA